jgi:hypothetical protein
MAFKRLTAAQRDALRYLRALGEMVVSPQDSRSLTILKRRGLVKYREFDGVRVAVLRETKAQQDVKRRLKRAVGMPYYGWTETGEQEHDSEE